MGIVKAVPSGASSGIPPSLASCCASDGPIGSGFADGHGGGICSLGGSSKMKISDWSSSWRLSVFTYSYSRWCISSRRRRTVALAFAVARR